ncbi:unnamed protein product [Staurois parvus]|uniref:Uncharacterized protein n=1 Tax=Staurois parvus TaxID=386267 RepID=A0ABN9HAR1_9NEOB|nr:unnamed protein product [Staurois parvus]
MVDPVFSDSPLLFTVPSPSADGTEPWGPTAHAQFGVYCYRIFFLFGKVHVISTGPIGIDRGSGVMQPHRTIREE